MSDRPAEPIRNDEQELALPDGWLRRRHPRRGGSPVPQVTVDGAAAGDIAALLRSADTRGAIEEALRSPDSEPDAVEAVRRHLSGDGSPLGAAAIASVLIKQQGPGFEEVIGRFADSWVTEYGLTFAACAFTELAHVALAGHRYHRPHRVDHKAISYLRPEDMVFILWRARDVPRKLRALLVDAADDAYEDAVKHLDDHRRAPMHKAMASYLIPTRHDWVEECIAVLPGARLDYSGWLPWCSVGSPGHAALLAGQMPFGYSEAEIDILTTVMEGVGTEIAPLLAAALDESPYLSADSRKLILQSLAMLPTDEAFLTLVGRLDKPYVEAAVSGAAKRFPVRALRLLAPASRGKSRISTAATELLRAHVPAHAELVARELPGLPAEIHGTVESIVVSTARLPDAPAEALPPVLTEPPWTGRRKAARPVTVAGLAPPELSSVSWADGERDEWATDRIGHWNSVEIAGDTIPDFATLSGFRQCWLIAYGPEDRVLPLLRTWDPEDMWCVGQAIRQIVARFGLDALPMALRVAKAGPASWGEALLPFLDPEVARLQASWLERLKSARRHATTWLDRHGLEAAMMLVPDAVGKAGAARSNAEGALRHIAARCGDAAVIEVAGRYGGEAEEAVTTLLATGPLEVLPARIPKVPGWADPLGLPQVLLRDRERGLPAGATGHLLTMLAMCRPGETYPGVGIVQEICDPATLAAFSWALFRRWQAHDSPSKDGWALTQLGLLGDDDTVRRLAPMIRSWPGEGGHARAVQGLDVLAAIGTDAALLHLHGIAQKVKFKGLRARAQEKIEQVAAELRLTPEQLADRLVPDFGLDADGGLTLDYGPRRFTVGFDEQLKPYVLDDNGKRRKALPKPGAKDDQSRAPAAYKRFAQLKKDVRTVAADQVQRLEAAMVRGRRWPLPEFRDLFVSHPLVWHIVRRLVLSAEHAPAQDDPAAHDRIATTFRIAEDRTFADIDDETVTLPCGATIGIPHPLDLGETLHPWSELFADYEILQPFAQLGRAVHVLSESERATGRLARFEGVTVPVGKVLGLQRRGWDRGEPQDSGVEPWISREIAPGHHVTIGLDPGIAAGAVEWFPEQKLAGVGLGPDPNAHGCPATAAPSFDGLPATAVSEVLSDLAWLSEPTT